MTTYETYTEAAKSSLKILVKGLEGSRKSKSVIEDEIKLLKEARHDLTTDEILSGEKQLPVIFYACNSFRTLKAKQLELAERDFRCLKNKEVDLELMNLYYPIMACKENPEYTQYYSNRQLPIRCLDTTKVQVVLITHAAVICENYNSICKVNNLKAISIIIDEFDLGQVIVPSIHFLLHTELDKKIKAEPDEQKVREMFDDVTSQHFSVSDVEILRALHKEGKMDEPFIASWLTDARDKKLRVVFISAETIPEILLTLPHHSLSFDVVDMNNSTDMKKHKVFIAPAEVNSFLFRRLNNEHRWNSCFQGFDTIISDRYSDTELSSEVDEIEIINHASARGSNLISGKLLVLISNIPNTAIEMLTACIQKFSKTKSYEKGFIKTMFFRDRLCQAVGRVLGHRWYYRTQILGESHTPEAFVIINSDLFDSIIKIDKETKLPVVKTRDGSLLLRDEIASSVPYTFHLWKYENEDFTDTISRVKDDKRISYSSQTDKISSIIALNNETNSKKIRELFIADETNSMSADEIKLICEQHQIKKYGKNTPITAVLVVREVLGVNEKQLKQIKLNKQLFINDGETSTRMIEVFYKGINLRHRVEAKSRLQQLYKPSLFYSTSATSIHNYLKSNNISIKVFQELFGEPFRYEDQGATKFYHVITKSRLELLTKEMKGAVK